MEERRQTRASTTHGKLGVTERSSTTTGDAKARGVYRPGPLRSNSSMIDSSPDNACSESFFDCVASMCRRHRQAEVGLCSANVTGKNHRVSGQWSVVKWSVVSGQWSVVSGRWPVVRSVVSGQ
jgi:hypothetical protein